MALWAHLPRLEAKRLRQRCQAAGTRLTADMVYNLALAETESAEKAQRAMSDYVAKRLSAGETPQ